MSDNRIAYVWKQILQEKQFISVHWGRVGEEHGRQPGVMSSLIWLPRSYSEPPGFAELQGAVQKASLAQVISKV
jgi:hypothetical protein